VRSPEGYVPARLSPARDRAGQAPAPRIAPTGPERFDDVPRVLSAPVAPAKTFEFIPFDRIALTTTPNYAVKGLLPRRGLAVVWGPPKCGKSFLVCDLMLHVALGWEYRGRRVQQGAVVYCALEGAEGFGGRLEAFRRGRLTADAGPTPFFLCPTPLDLVAEHHAFAAAIMGTLGGVAPAIIVIDTVNRSLAGSESDDRDMSNYIKAADFLRDTFKCLVLVVHHSGVDASRPRGHTSLAGAVDAQIAVKKDVVGGISATVEFMKDGPEGAQVASHLVSVQVGVDDDGDPITSCIVEPAESDGQAKPKVDARKLPNLTDAQKLALDALLTLVLDIGQPVPAAFNLPGVVRAVPVVKWCDELVRRGVLDLEDKNHRVVSKRIRDGLCVKSRAGQRDGLIWPL